MTAKWPNKEEKEADLIFNSCIREEKKYLAAYPAELQHLKRLKYEETL